MPAKLTACWTRCEPPAATHICVPGLPAATKAYYPGDRVTRATTTTEVVPRIIHEQARGPPLGSPPHNKSTAATPDLRRRGCRQGIAAFWRGNGAQMARVFPVTAIKFSCYDQIKALTMPKGEEHYSGAEGFLRKAPTPHCTPPGGGCTPTYSG